MSFTWLSNKTVLILSAVLLFIVSLAVSVLLLNTHILNSIVRNFENFLNESTTSVKAERLEAIPRIEISSDDLHLNELPKNEEGPVEGACNRDMIKTNLERCIFSKKLLLNGGGSAINDMLNLEAHLMDSGWDYTNGEDSSYYIRNFEQIYFSPYPQKEFVFYQGLEMRKNIDGMEIGLRTKITPQDRTLSDRQENIDLYDQNQSARDAIKSQSYQILVTLTYDRYLPL